MGRKRGFFAELQHQQRVAQRRNAQAAQAAARRQAAAIRQHEQAVRQAERAHAQAVRAAAADRKKAEAEAKRLHVEARNAEVVALNEGLQSTYDDIDLMLMATLDVDDHVDLETLRTVVEHPPFPRPDLEVPVPPPEPMAGPPEPQYHEPPEPSGLRAVMGGRKRHEQAVAAARAAYWQQRHAWEAEMSQLPARQLAQVQAHDAQEAQRVEELGRAREAYDVGCRAREEEARRADAPLDALLEGLARDDESAVQEYVSIVLSNSVYPEAFPVEHDFEFDSSLRELTLAVTVPAPSELPSIKAYRYQKANDEIVSAQLTQKEQKERYAGAVHQVALRTLHEVFEADRDGRIQTISLTVGVEAIDPALGRPQRVDLVAVAVDREGFVEIDLSNVTPMATLEHLGAVMSKNPFGLAAIDGSKGVRGR